MSEIPNISPSNQDSNLPPREDFAQILQENFLHPFNWAYRESRKSFWLTYLTYDVIILVLAIVYAVMDLTQNHNTMSFLIGSLLLVIVMLYLSLVELGATVRRLHDAGLNGWWYLLTLIPYASFIVTIIFGVLPTKQEPVHFEQYLFQEQH